MANSIPPMMVQIQLDLDRLNSEVAKATKKIDELGTNIKHQGAPVDELKGKIEHLVHAFLGFEAIKKVGEFLKESSKKAAENAKSFEIFNLTLQHTTMATKEQIKATDEHLEKLALTAGMVTSDVRPSFNILVRATKDTTQALNLQQLALDTAAYAHKPLITVTMALSKSINGNQNALNRLLPEMKNVTDKMGYLQKQTKGAAEAAANVDPYQRLNATMTTLQEHVGTALLPSLNKFADWFAANLPLIQQTIPVVVGITVALAAMKAGTMAVNFVDAIWANMQTIKAARAEAAAAALAAETAATEGVAVATTEATLTTKGFTLALASTGIGAIAIAVGFLTTQLMNLNGQMDAASADRTNNAYVAMEQKDIEDKATAAADAAEKAFRDSWAKANPSQALKITPEMADPTSEFYQSGTYQKWKALGYKIGDLVGEPGTTAGADALQIARDQAYAATQAARQSYWQQKDAVGQNVDATAQALLDAKNSLTTSVQGLQTALNPIDFMAEKLGRIQQAVRDSFSTIASNLKTAVDAGAITAKASTALQNYADKEKSVLEQIGAARDALATKYDLAKTLMGNIKDDIAKMISIDTLGQTAQSVLATFDQVGSKIVAFGKNIMALKTSGLNKDFLTEIAKAGVNGGSALAQGLATATPEQIQAINDSYLQIQNASSATAEAVGQSVYGDGVDVGQGLLAGIVAQDAALQNTAMTMGQKFAKTFATAVKAATTSKSDAAFQKTMANYLADQVPASLQQAVTAPSSAPVIQDWKPSQTIIVNNSNQTQASPMAIAQQTINAIRFGLPMAPIGATS